MRKHFLLTKTLLVALLCLVGQSVWATPTIIKTYDFYTASTNAASETSLGSSGTTNIGSTACNNLTGDWAGVAVQGASAWFLNRGGNHAYDGYYNNNGGGRLFALLNLQAGDIVHITANSGLPTTATNATYDSVNSTEGTDCYYTVSANGHFAISFPRYKQIMVATITRDIADLVAPTYEITGANGNERQVTLSCLTDGAVIKYNTTDDKSAAGWTTYSAPFYTAETTLYAYSEKSATTSDVVEITTGAGTTLKLNTPVISKTAYADGDYTVSISSDQASLAVVPSSPSVKYSIDGGSALTYSSPFSVASGKTITTWVENAGYTSSDEAATSTTARPTDYSVYWTQDYRNVTSAAGTDPQAIGLSDVVFTVDGVDFKNIISYGTSATEVSLNTNVGLNTNSGVILRTNGANSGILVNNSTDAKIGIQNLKVGDYVVLSVMNVVPTASYGVTLQEGMSLTSEYYFLATETSASINIPKGTYNYVYSVKVLSAPVPVTLGSNGYATFASPYALDLTTANLPSGVTAYKASVSGTTVTFTPLNQTVPANTGVLLKGTGTVNIPVAATGTAVEGNEFLVNEGGATFTGDDSYYYFGLLKNTDPLTFRKFVPSTTAIPADKAYLKVSKSSVDATARGLEFVFDDEVTSIGEELRVKSEEFAPAAEFYDLQGRKVAQPQKGLYIVNGKKVVLK